VIALIAAGMFAATMGCGGSNNPEPPTTRGGIDVKKLTDAFKDSPEEVRTTVDQSMLNLRYGQFGEAMAKLDGLASDSRVTDAQKSAITNTMESIKKKAEGAASAEPAR
jgi:hypothetical protein